MARKDRVWDTNVIEVSLANNDQIASGILIRNPDGAVSPGKIWLNRLIGHVSVFIDDYVAGSRLSLWHGAWLHPDTMPAGTANIIQSDGGDEEANQGAWLWREPIPLFRTAVRSEATDYSVDHLYDWGIRGGKGSECAVGQRVSYVVNLKVRPDPAGAPANVVVTNTFLALFSGT